MQIRIFVLLLCLQSVAASAAPRVVTSIAPLHEITTAIMAGIAKPDLIIQDHASAHHFAFKPSHMRLLQQADLVIWVGRHFEAGFNRVPGILRPSTRQIELIPELDIEGENGHIWYSPTLLQRSVKIIATTLGNLDPQHQAQYRVNANRLIDAIENWRRDTQAHWQNRRPRFLTDHAFSDHFENEMKLKSIATIHDQHDGQGGLKDLNRIESLLRQNPATCLLTLENPASPLAQSIAQKYGIKIVNVLLVPATNKSQPHSIQRLDQLNTALLACL